MTQPPHPPETAVLGAGNGGLALAGDLALRGGRVRLWEHPDFATDFAPVLATGEIVVEDGSRARTETARLTLATHDLETALRGIAVVHLVVPVSAQERLIWELLPLLTDNQTLVIWAGRFGGLRALTLQKEHQARRFGIVELNTLPHGSRRTAPGRVSINFRAIVLYGASARPGQGDSAVAAVRASYPELRTVGSLLEVSFRNSGIPLLGAGTLMNIGAIEARGADFALFRDGMTATVRRAIRTAHLEMIGVGRAYGFDIQPYPDAIYNGPTSIEGANFRDRQGGTDGFLRLTGPDRLVHRYTIENVRYGLAVVAALGERAGIATPFISALCTICDELSGPDFKKFGWRLAQLGF